MKTMYVKFKEPKVKQVKETIENGKVVKKIVLAIVLDKDEKPVNEIIGHVELCVLLEMMLRYLNDNEIKKNTKSKNKTIKYFLLPEMAIYYKLYKVL